MLRIVFVMPWFGKGINGGAEQQGYRSAYELQRAGHDVQVWATCIRDFRSEWVDYYRPGDEIVDGLTVRRFRACPPGWQRSSPQFIAVMDQLGIQPTEEHRYVPLFVRSVELERAIADAPAETRFIFLPYLFGTSFWGSKIRPADSFLMPCLHDESYAHLPQFRGIFRQLRGCLFLSRPEQALARRLYGLPADRCHLVGAIVPETPVVSPSLFLQAYGIRTPFILYLGRKDEGKNFHLLVEYFRRYRRQRASDLSLVLIGPGTLPPRQRTDGVIDLGFIPETHKLSACAAATVLCNPSRNESFSFVVMEAWLAGTPVLVDTHCAVTRDHCLASNGGLFYGHYREFAACLDWLLEDDSRRARMAELGRRYVRRNFQAADVCRRLERAILS